VGFDKMVSPPIITGSSTRILMLMNFQFTLDLQGNLHAQGANVSIILPESRYCKLNVKRVVIFEVDLLLDKADSFGTT
jgi:hypothetical protein